MNKPDKIAAAQPLYVQVRDILRGRIQSGYWKPGEGLPNEFMLGRELGVSQGTARKALDSLALEHLVERRQGRGTFVTEHTPDHVQFRFFRLYDENGEQIQPDSRDVRVTRARAGTVEQQKLGLKKSQYVLRIRRVRTANGVPCLTEAIVVPEKSFPGLDREAHLPNTLYDYFQRRYNVTIARADERITAIAAGRRDAEALGIEIGTPLLEVDRVAFGLDDTPVEWRLSRCLTDSMHYFQPLT